MRALRGYYEIKGLPSYDNTTKNRPPWINDPNALLSNQVNLDDSDSPYSPSQDAWNAIRDMIATDSSTAGDPSPSNNNPTKSTNQTNTNNANSQANTKKIRDQLRSKLFKYVVDCWIIYEDNSQTS